MDTIPEFRAEKNLPFDLDKHLDDIRKEYNKYYDKYVKDFRDALERDDKECTIMVHQEWSRNSALKVPFLKEKAAENFVWRLKQKNYPCDYAVKSKRHGNHNSGNDHENWSQITISLK